MTKQFGFSTTADDVIEGYSLAGFNALVTGASTGLGAETARALAKAGAAVVITARDIPKGERVAQQIKESTGNQHIEVMKLDLGSLEGVDAFVKAYLGLKRPLHILVNNAGLQVISKTLTQDGFEAHFGTNHLGPFRLTLGLIPALQEGAKQLGKYARVINVASAAHGIMDVNYEDPNFESTPYDSFFAYGQSKTANILFSLGLTKRFEARGIVSNAVHPGIIRTEISVRVLACFK